MLLATGAERVGPSVRRRCHEGRNPAAPGRKRGQRTQEHIARPPRARCLRTVPEAATGQVEQRRHCFETHRSRPGQFECVLRACEAMNQRQGREHVLLLP